MISKRSIVNPCGLLSLRTELIRSQRVTKLRSVTLLALMIRCRAYVTVL